MSPIPTDRWSRHEQHWRGREREHRYVDEDAGSGVHRLFVPGEVLVEQGESLQAQLTARIPDLFDGLPTEVKVTTVQQCFLDQLGPDVSVVWDAYDWVRLPEQRLCAMTAGAVFHDDLDLEQVRLRLAYYPRDVWLYVMLAGWWRVHPEMNLVGRAGYAGDETRVDFDCEQDRVRADAPGRPGKCR